MTAEEVAIGTRLKYQHDIAIWEVVARTYSGYIIETRSQGYWHQAHLDEADLRNCQRA